MKTILVTGGAGYIGSHTTKQLIEKGYQVVIVDNLSNSKKQYVHPESTFYKGDVLDYKLIKSIFTNHQIDAVMHFAGKISVNESTKHPLRYFSNNVEGTRMILHRMRRLGIKYFVFSSTAAVYGEPEVVPVNEETKTAPINPYGMSKLFAEQVIRESEKAYGIKHTIFRYFNVAGADTESGLRYDPIVPATHLIPCVNEAALGIRDKLEIFGNDYSTKDGTAIRDYVHVVDLARAHVLGLEKMFEDDKSKTICLSSGNGYSVQEVYDTAKDVLNTEIPVQYSERREGDPESLIATNERAKKELN